MAQQQFTWGRAHGERKQKPFKHRAENGNDPKLTVLDTQPPGKNQEGSKKLCLLILLTDND